MLILAFDTTSAYGGAGIFRDTGRLALASAEHSAAPPALGGQLDYSVILFQMVDRLLAQSRLTLQEIELFVVAHGPGSFTGIRVGVSAAQAWGEAFGRPVFGASVLEAMAEESGAGTEWTISIADARRGEFYVAAFPGSRRHSKLEGTNRKPPSVYSRLEQGGEQLEQDEPTIPLETVLLELGFPLSRSREGLILKPEQLRRVLSIFARDGPVTCVLREHDLPAQAIRTNLAGEAFAPSQNTCGKTPLEHEDSAAHGFPSLRWQVLRGTLVDGLARLGLRACSEDRLQSPAELDALYIRRPDAEIHWAKD